MSDPYAVFPYHVHELCWHCNYGLMEPWRYCPNCGLWLMNERPISVLRNQPTGSLWLMDVRGMSD